jgi:dTDP-L-rhamnose 4-epimerase
MEDGRQRRDFVHVTDVAAAQRRRTSSADPEPTGFGAANVCSGEPHTIGDLAAELARAMDGPEPEIVGGARPGDVRHVVADPAYAAARLGFRARTTFTDGVTAFATDPLRSPITTTAEGRRSNLLRDPPAFGGRWTGGEVKIATCTRRSSCRASTRRRRCRMS